jgi:DNA-binding response OmpR family regulator
MTAAVISVSAKSRRERRQLLEQADYRVFTADSFDAGSALVRRVQPDLLIVDVRLLEFNGVHLALRAREDSPGTRTVVVGEPDVVLERDAAKIGAQYLSPSDLPAFLASLHRHA